MVISEAAASSLLYKHNIILQHSPNRYCIWCYVLHFDFEHFNIIFLCQSLVVRQILWYLFETDFNAHRLGTGLSDNNPPAFSVVKWSLCNWFVEWNAETPNPSSITNCRTCDKETNAAQVRFAWGRICTELSSPWNYSLVLWLPIARISTDYTLKMTHPRWIYSTIRIKK